MSHDKLYYMKECLIHYVEQEMCNLPEVNAEELGEAIDMIKDLEEAIYYCVSIVAILCGVAYKIGYEHGKNAKK